MNYISQQVGDFFVQSLLQEGERASIYLAHQISVERDVDLKIISADSSESAAKFHARFYQEMAKIVTLEHLHIVPIYKYGIIEKADSVYIATRLMEGSLADLLAHGEPLPLAHATQIFRQIAGALSFAHQKGVLHFGLKPNNIRFDEQGNAYLSEFALGRIARQRERTPLQGLLLNLAMVYLAPEQIRGESLDERTDQYVLGAILYHMLAGKSPFEATNTSFIDRLVRSKAQLLPDLSTVNPQIFSALNNVVMRALHPAPSERYTSVDEFVSAFDSAMRVGRRGGTRIITGNTPTQSQKAQEKRKPRRFFDVRRWSLWRRINSLFWVMICLVAVFVLLRSSPTQTGAIVEYIRPPMIIPRTRGGIQDSIPTDTEISAALQALGKTRNIAYIACGLESETQIVRAREMSDLAREHQLNYVIYDGGMNEAIQLVRVEQARREGAVVLIVCPLGARVIQSLARAQDAGMAVIITEGCESVEVGVCVGLDNYFLGGQAGQVAANWINAQYTITPRIIHLQQGAPLYLMQRSAGMLDSLYALFPQSLEMMTYPITSRQSAKIVVESLLTQNIAFDMILSSTDIGAYGAIDALELAGISPDAIDIVSIESESLARNYVERGYFLRATIGTNRRTEAHAAINTAIKLIAGGIVPQRINIPIGEPFVMVSS